MRTFICIVGCCLALGSNLRAETSPAGLWQVIPGVSVGPVSAFTGEQDLQKIYDASQLVAAEIEVGEGFTEPGSILFPHEPTKRLEIIWTGPQRVRPREIRINAAGSRWQTVDGIGIGSDLKTIERLNGKPFRLFGFGWDYGGSIYHADGGKLTQLGVAADGHPQGRTLMLRLSPTHAQMERSEYSQVEGDRLFSSGHPAMQRLNPRVDEMIVTFEAR